MNDPIDLLGMTTTKLEMISFVLALITVVLNIRRIHWAWLFSIVSSATYAVVFYNTQLYGAMALQFVFIAVSVWGWYQWLHGGEERAPLAVTRSTTRQLQLAGAFWVVSFVLIALFLDHFTDSEVPYPDGFVTAGSLVAQILLSRKKVENWIVWIVVDVLYVGLYVYQGLPLTAVLYAVFVVLAAIGLSAWQRDVRRAP